MRNLASILVTAIMLASLLAGFLHAHEDSHDCENHSASTPEQECMACVFQQTHKSATVDPVRVVQVLQDSEHRVLHIVSRPLFHSEQAPGVPRAPPCFS